MKLILIHAYAINFDHECSEKCRMIDEKFWLFHFDEIDSSRICIFEIESTNSFFFQLYWLYLNLQRVFFFWIYFRWRLMKSDQFQLIDQNQFLRFLFFFRRWMTFLLVIELMRFINSIDETIEWRISENFELENENEKIDFFFIFSISTLRLIRSYEKNIIKCFQLHKNSEISRNRCFIEKQRRWNQINSFFHFFIWWSFFMKCVFFTKKRFQSVLVIAIHWIKWRFEIMRLKFNKVWFFWFFQQIVFFVRVIILNFIKNNVFIIADISFLGGLYAKDVDWIIIHQIIDKMFSISFFRF